MVHLRTEDHRSLTRHATSPERWANCHPIKILTKGFRSFSTTEDENVEGARNGVTLRGFRGGLIGTRAYHE